jgi:hypothetical protein
MTPYNRSLFERRTRMCVRKLMEIHPTWPRSKCMLAVRKFGGPCDLRFLLRELSVQCRFLHPSSKSQETA